MIEADIQLNEEGSAFAPFSVRMLLQSSILDKLEPLQTIGVVASKEFSLEKVLEKMRNDWEGVAFRITEYKDTGTYIMGGTDEVQVSPLIPLGLGLGFRVWGSHWVCLKSVASMVLNFWSDSSIISGGHLFLFLNNKIYE